MSKQHDTIERRQPQQEGNPGSGSGVSPLPNRSRMHFYVLIALCGLAVTGVGFPVMSSGVFISPMAADLGFLRGSISFSHTLTLIFKALLSLWVPTLIQRFSLKKVILTGVLLVGLGNIFTGLSQQLWLFYLWGALRGIGAGLLAWVPINMVINQWFAAKHGLVTSVVLSLSSVTGAVFTPIFTQWIDQFGWALTFQLMGGLAILFGLPAIILNFSLDPRTSGYLPYGYEEVADNSAAVIKRGVEYTTATDLQTIPYAPFYLLMVFGFFQTVMTALTQHFPGFANDIGLSLEEGAFFAAAAMISSIFCKLALGYLSDSLGTVRSTFLMLGMMGSGLLVILWAPNFSLLVLGSILFGAVYTMPSVGLTLLTRHFFGLDLFARLYPRIAFATSFGSGVGIAVVGFIFDFTGSYHLAFLLTISVLIFDMAVLIWIQRRLKSFKFN